MNEIRIGKVSISSYGDYKSGNYGKNAMTVSVGTLELYFSYRTVIAISKPGVLIVSQNEWGPTTGKHLNWIDGGDKKNRVPRVEFEAKLQKMLREHNLA